MPFDERKCRICGCTDNCACPGGCYWVEEDLCSRCVEKAEMDKNYKCIYCGGTGELEVHGPGETYTRTCRDCRGSGEKLIEIPLREYDELKNGINKVSQFLQDNNFEEASKAIDAKYEL